MGHATQPGDCPSGGPNTLALPCNFGDQLDDRKRRRLDMVQIEFARDASLLQSRAYDAILKIISEGCDD
jgi:hypothetical protein